jgi:putative phosphoribosyl transferase
MKRFKDRIDAGNQLADKLKNLDLEKAVLLAIPRGGVEIGYVLSQKLNLTLDVIFIKKIGHPLNKELAIGSVSQYGRVLDDSFGISQDYINTETSRIKYLLDNRQKEYVGNRVSTPLKNKTVILTDDGIATGHTMLAALNVVKANKPAKIIVAVPVASSKTMNALKEEVDFVICEICPIDFYAVGQFYEAFPQLEDKDAIEFLKKANKIHIET